MTEPSAPYPLFPPLTHLKEHARAEQPINYEIRRRLEAIPTHLYAMKTWQTGIAFLIEQSQRPDFQERHYRVLCPIIESMMHWSWSIRSKPLQDWDSLDARAFMDFIMRPPITWVTTPGCSRYSKKARQSFEYKSLDPEWRPIIRKTLSGSDPGLSSRHHRNWFITRGREYFDFALDPASTKENPFGELQPRDFDVRIQKRSTIFTREQLNDLLEIAESLTNYNVEWEPFLFITAVAIYSDIPLRALAATQTIKPTFSYFKARVPEATFEPVTTLTKTELANLYLSSRYGLFKGPGHFESPLYPGRQFALASQFTPFFLRYAQFRRLYSRSVSHKSFLMPLGHGADAYGYGSLIENLSEFTASILEELRARPAAAREQWRGSGKLDPSTSLTFVELRKSASRAGLIPNALVSKDDGKVANVWPDIGIREEMSAEQWFKSH
ncbi:MULTISPECIES: hypothetical protein [unclassified Pseudomonas]|uniref:hypothetical protein n=1 Tax=unclassified Pseudomonas TaxID=196821 RepID=UPI00224AC2D1|nr:MULTISPECIES: hypothetical protein [unclassified Pseudomonas]MCX2812499.1 hypothetical protein [Pseudomonas sp. DCB_E]MCX9140508.1 hypothetical protein [Pseudomonas sp. DCB_Q]